MLDYQSSFDPPQPYTQQQKADALAGLRVRNPYATYGRNQQDILNAAGDANAAAFDAASTKANSDFELQKLQAQQDLALAGLQQMSQAQQQNNQLGTQRLGVMNSFISPILQGLFS